MSISGDSVAGEIFITLDNDFVFFLHKNNSGAKKDVPAKVGNVPWKSLYGAPLNWLA